MFLETQTNTATVFERLFTGNEGDKTANKHKGLWKNKEDRVPCGVYHARN